MYHILHIPWHYGNNNLYLFYSIVAQKKFYSMHINSEYALMMIIIDQ